MSEAKQDDGNPPDSPFSQRLVRNWLMKTFGPSMVVKVETDKLRSKASEANQSSFNFLSDPHPMESMACDPEFTTLLNASEKIRAAADRLDAVEGELMEREEFKQAELSLQRALEDAPTVAERQLKQSYLNALQGLHEIEESRLTLLQRTANTRRYLADLCELKDFKAFAALAPGQIGGNESNLSRVFERMRDSDDILSVELYGKLLYPTIQIDPESLKIFKEIPPLLKEARAKSYTNWDILEWLATEQFEEVTAVPEKPVEYTTPKELLHYGRWRSHQNRASSP